MKRILFIILFFSIAGSYGEAVPDSHGKWGYIHHIARLDKGYIESNLGAYEIISITGFTITGPGRIFHDNNTLFQAVVREAKKNKTIVYPLISFSSPALGHKILENERLRKELADTLIRYARENGWSGVHLDFEYLPSDDALNLSYLLRELKEKSHGVKITMAVFPPVDFPGKYAAFHNPAFMSPHVDEIVLMAYDLHRPGTGPGPVTDLAWAEKNIRELLRFYGNGRIWLGVPAYGYSWQGKDARTISARQGDTLAGKFGSRRDKSGCLSIRYPEGNKIREACVPDRDMREKMSGLAGKYRLRGTALWRLGFEE